MPFTGAPSQPWSDTFHRWAIGGMQAVIMAVIGAIGLYVQQHPVPTPVVQTAPVPVVNVQPVPLTLEQLQARLLELQIEHAKK